MSPTARPPLQAEPTIEHGQREKGLNELHHPLELNPKLAQERFDILESRLSVQILSFL